MRALAIYSRPGSSKVQEEVKALNKWVEAQNYQFYVNWDANEEVSKDADKFVTEAIQKLDASMKGWLPVKEGTETHYQISHTEDGIEYTYIRHYYK